MSPCLAAEDRGPPREPDLHRGRQHRRLRHQACLLPVRRARRRGSRRPCPPNAASAHRRRVRQLRRGARRWARAAALPPEPRLHWPVPRPADLAGDRQLLRVALCVSCSHLRRSTSRTTSGTTTRFGGRSGRPDESSVPRRRCHLQGACGRADTRLHPRDGLGSLRPRRRAGGFRAGVRALLQGEIRGGSRERSGRTRDRAASEGDRARRRSHRPCPYLCRNVARRRAQRRDDRARRCRSSRAADRAQCCRRGLHEPNGRDYPGRICTVILSTFASLRHLPSGKGSFYWRTLPKRMVPRSATGPSARSEALRASRSTPRRISALLATAARSRPTTRNWPRTHDVFVTTARAESTSSSCRETTRVSMPCRRPSFARSCGCYPRGTRGGRGRRALPRRPRSSPDVTLPPAVRPTSSLPGTSSAYDTHGEMRSARISSGKHRDPVHYPTPPHLSPAFAHLGFPKAASP